MTRTARDRRSAALRRFGLSITVLTVLGYVLFLGALVAIMTQWLHERMSELEAGLTPIAQRDHILIIGWNNRTTTIVRELVMSSERVRRFLQRRNARSLRLAILAEVRDRDEVRVIEQRHEPCLSDKRLSRRLVVAHRRDEQLQGTAALEPPGTTPNPKPHLGMPAYRELGLELVRSEDLWY